MIKLFGYENFQFDKEGTEIATSSSLIVAENLAIDFVMTHFREIFSDVQFEFHPQIIESDGTVKTARIVIIRTTVPDNDEIPFKFGRPFLCSDKFGRYDIKFMKSEILPTKSLKVNSPYLRTFTIGKSKVMASSSFVDMENPRKLVKLDYMYHHTFESLEYDIIQWHRCSNNKRYRPVVNVKTGEFDLSMISEESRHIFYAMRNDKIRGQHVDMFDYLRRAFIEYKTAPHTEANGNTMRVIWGINEFDLQNFGDKVEIHSKSSAPITVKTDLPHLFDNSNAVTKTIQRIVGEENVHLGTYILNWMKNGSVTSSTDEHLPYVNYLIDQIPKKLNGNIYRFESDGGYGLVISKLSIDDVAAFVTSLLLDGPGFVSVQVQLVRFSGKKFWFDRPEKRTVYTQNKKNFVCIDSIEGTVREVEVLDKNFSLYYGDIDRTFRYKMAGIKSQLIDVMKRVSMSYPVYFDEDEVISDLIQNRIFERPEKIEIYAHHKMTELSIKSGFTKINSGWTRSLEG